MYQGLTWFCVAGALGFFFAVQMLFEKRFSVWQKAYMWFYVVLYTTCLICVLVHFIGPTEPFYPANVDSVHPQFSQWGTHTEVDSDGKVHRYMQFKGPPVEIGP